MRNLGPFEENTIVIGDCLDIMAQMPDKCVDLAVTDPPYQLANYAELAPLWAQQLFRVAKSIAVTVGIQRLQIWLRLPYELGWVLCWHKPFVLSRIHHKPIYMGLNNWEPILLYNTNCQKQLSDYRKIPLKYDKDLTWFPHPKPIDVFAWVIENFSKEGDLIADFFIGSGTTAIAADKLGRRFFGCDINPDYVKMALERVKKGMVRRNQHQLNLFEGE